VLLVYGNMYDRVAKRKTLNLTGQDLRVVDSQAAVDITWRSML
jgi:hypothetical protein